MPNGGHPSDPDKAAAMVLRAKRVFELKQQGLTFHQIADELSIAIGTAHADYTKYLATIPAPAVEEYREQQRQQLVQMRAVVQDVILRRHAVISEGHIVFDADGPVLDDGPLLAAVDRLLKIQDREAKLFGLDARPEVQITGTLAYEVLGFGVRSDERAITQ